LALSSRNAYLTDAQRKQACTLYQQLLHFAERYQIQSLADQVIEGEQSQEPDERLADWVARAEQDAKGSLQAQGWQVDYLSLRRCADLEPAHDADPVRAADSVHDVEYRHASRRAHGAEYRRKGEALVLLAAARLGQTRLIDNLEI
jgi:pantoate--beta-alanine ligase